MQEGWVCPRCGRVYAPWVAMCSWCSLVTTGSITITYPETPGGMPRTGDPLPPGPYTTTCGTMEIETK